MEKFFTKLASFVTAFALVTGSFAFSAPALFAEGTETTPAPEVETPDASATDEDKKDELVESTDQNSDSQNSGFESLSTFSLETFDTDESDPVVPVKLVLNETSGVEYSTIQEAITNAESGNVISVKAGVFNEALVINKSITLKGAKAGIDPRPSVGSSRTTDSSDETVVVTVKSGRSVNITANNVVVDGFVLKHEGGASTNDIVKASASQSDIIIKNNIILDASDEAIQLEAGDNYIVENNYILNPVGDGITISTYAPTKGSNTKVVNNDIVGSQSAFGSIYLYGSQGVIIEGNTITTNSSGIALGSDGLAVKDVVVKNNVINTALRTAYSAIAVGIGVDGNSENITIEGNSVNQVADLDTRENTFPERFGVVRVGIASAANPVNVVLKGNSFSKVLPQNYVFIGSGVTNKVVATNNWWNEITSPESKINKPELVDFSMWLCEEAPSNWTSNVDGECVEVAEPEPQPTRRSSGGSRAVADRNTGEVLGDQTGPVGEVLGASAYNFTRDLTVGLRGDDVTALQAALIASGDLAITAPTGYFGDLTKAAVAKWQARNGVPATGYFGPLSRAAFASAGTPAATMTAEQRAAAIAELLKKVAELQEKIKNL